MGVIHFHFQHPHSKGTFSPGKWPGPVVVIATTPHQAAICGFIALDAGWRRRPEQGPERGLWAEGRPNFLSTATNNNSSGGKS